MSWLSQIFGRRTAPAGNSGLPTARPATVVENVATRSIPMIERETLERHAERMEREAARTNDARLRETARRIRERLR